MARPIKAIALAATAAVLVALAFAQVWTACEAAENANNPDTSVAAADSDFRRRCQARGVVRYFDFDSQEAADLHIFPPSRQKVKRGKIVGDVKASGAGALRQRDQHRDT